MAITINRGRALGLLDMTPMLDMVFNLLIFFLVVSHFASKERDLKVVLPEGSEAMPLVAKPQQIFINIDQEGQYYVSGQKFTVQELARLLAESAVNHPGQAVIIRADRRVAWDFVATAMRLCNEAGLRDYSAALAEEPEETRG
jgi:biopolymer transport protein ExbD